MKRIKQVLYCLLGVILVLTIFFYIGKYIDNKNYEKYEKKYEKMVEKYVQSNNKESSISELRFSEDQLKIYNEISLLINKLDSSEEHLIRLLDTLRNSLNLNSKVKINALIIAINKEIENGGINYFGVEEINKLKSILKRLSNEKVIQYVGIDGYWRYKKEILAILPTDTTQSIEFKEEIKKMFLDFEENIYVYSLDERSQALEQIRNTIIDYHEKRYGENSLWINDYTPFFCEIFDYFDIINKKCISLGVNVQANYFTY